MILSGDEIKNQVRSGQITINPFLIENINPNSYNYRIGKEIIEIDEAIIDPKQSHSVRNIEMDEGGFLLKPNKLYLARTLEEIGSNKFVASLIGRSSIGRLGLFLQITADLGHLGTSHCWTLELHAVQPLKIYPFMKIGQVSFWEPDSSSLAGYDSGYTQYSLPQTSNFFKEFGRKKRK